MIKQACKTLRKDIEALKENLAGFKELFAKQDFDRAGDYQVDYEQIIKGIRYQLQGMDFILKTMYYGMLMKKKWYRIRSF